MNIVDFYIHESMFYEWNLLKFHFLASLPFFIESLLIILFLNSFIGI